MTKLFTMLTLAAFLIAVPLAMAEQPATPKVPGGEQTSINCCAKGKCSKAASEVDCAKEGGKVVKDCKDCK
ncbi:MAG TPA: hypothetical protein VK463_14850 [Desulfomonilaceae bacterium]|nr:hypothetical protein [Desulfomonilaceae bacterium]